MAKIVGINPVKELLKSKKKIEKLTIYSGVNKEKIIEILNLAKKKKVIIEYTDEKMENSQGLVAEVTEYNYEIDEGEFLEKLVKEKEAIILILDGIQDPGNFGALLRSAEAFGIKGVIIPERNSVKVNETVIKTSTGAIEHVDIVRVTNISNFIGQLKKIDFWVYGAEADGLKSYYEENYPEKTCIVLGSEGFGIRKKVKEKCDILLNIPMFGKINSLNVSVAGGILLSEISKNRRG